MLNSYIINQLKQYQTPFYFYDTDLLHKTLFAIKEAASLFSFKLHFAIKANANKNILSIINDYNIGADCVSGNEIKRALNAGFPAHNIVFAGVGKTDEEIKFAIESDIFCINCESLEELEVINSLAGLLNKKPRTALRINPNVDAETHRNITTGLNSNKFGISVDDLQYIVDHFLEYNNLLIDGLHFHIGSQITNLNVFKNLCYVVNAIQKKLKRKNILINHLNLGGGLGINYENPENRIPDFQAYFSIFHKYLNLLPEQTVHFEPGRSIVGQSGMLLTRILYVKSHGSKKTIILDAGFTELLRPALYQANHKIINLTSQGNLENYDIAGPICETSDYFGKSITLPQSKRGDLIAILSAGAYGESMASSYNLRSSVRKYFLNTLAEEQREKILTKL